MSYLRITLVVAIAAFLVPTIASAQFKDPFGASKPKRPASNSASLVLQLDLTPKQKQDIRKILLTARITRLRTQAEIDVAGVELRAELEKDQPKEAIVGTLIERISAQEGALRKSRVVSWLRIRKLLSAKQQKQLKGLEKPTSKAKPKKDIPEGLCDEVACLVNPYMTCCKSTSLSVTGDAGTTIYVDGRNVGPVPLKLNIAPGYHSVEARFTDGLSDKKEVVLKARSRQSLRFSSPKNMLAPSF